MHTYIHTYIHKHKYIQSCAIPQDIFVHGAHFHGSTRSSGLLPVAAGVIGVVALVVAIVAVYAVDGFIDAVAVVRASNNHKSILVISKLEEVGFQGP